MRQHFGSLNFVIYIQSIVETETCLPASTKTELSSAHQGLIYITSIVNYTKIVFLRLISGLFIWPVNILNDVKYFNRLYFSQPYTVSNKTLQTFMKLKKTNLALKTEIVFLLVITTKVL